MGPRRALPDQLGKLLPRPYLTVRAIARALREGADGLTVEKALLRRPSPMAEGRAVNVSPFHLARSFRRQTGYTLHEYRTHLRLRAALERLADGDEDVAVIARAVGFSSHSHLTASFRRAFGVPPSCVRKRTLPPYA